METCKQTNRLNMFEKLSRKMRREIYSYKTNSISDYYILETEIVDLEFIILLEANIHRHIT